MSVDPHSLESHLGRVRGRSKYVPHDAAVALGAFVCPRADGYGAREGVIPPGVAAQHGLIPKGLREVSTDAALHSGRQDDAHPLTAQEQYRAYYGRGVQQQRPTARPRVVLPPAPVADTAGEDTPAFPEAQGVQVVQEPYWPEAASLRTDARRAEEGSAVPPPVTRAPARSTRPASKKATAKLDSAAPQRSAGKPAVLPKTPRTSSKPAKAPSRVFFPVNAAENDPETLEGFYAGLSRERHLEGVAEQAWPETTEPVETHGTQSGDAAPPRAGGVPAVTPPRTHGSVPPVVDPRVAELEAALAEQQQLAQDWYNEAERRRLDLERHQLLLSHQNAELQRLTKVAAAAQVSHADGPVRVSLGMEDVKLKVAGNGWDCNILGHLCYSRGKTEVALVVTDPSYGSDLLAIVQESACVIVSAEGRTACQYRGHCDKIYGETDSPDFITVMRFACDPNKAFA